MTDLTYKSITLHPSAVATIKQHCRAESEKGGYEAVGFVGQRPGAKSATGVMKLNNHSPDPQHGFLVEPWEQFRAEKTLKDEGYEIIAVYHSHVASEALPSQFDHKFAWRGVGALIYSVVFDELKAYVREDDWLMPIELEIK